MELILKFPMLAFELSILGNRAAHVASSGDRDRTMKFSRPIGWLLGFSCIAPAVAALVVDAVIRFLERLGAFKTDEFGGAPVAGVWTLLICIGCSLFPAVWLNRKESLAVTVVYWGSLAILDIAITIPGCSFLWG